MAIDNDKDDPFEALGYLNRKLSVKSTQKDGQNNGLATI